MKVLVVGSGGREHALCHGIAKSPRLRRLICAPGNPGIEGLAETAPVAADDVPGLVALARKEQVDLVVVGPEAPLALGLADALRAEGIACFGPSRAAAEIESSKAFAKELTKRAKIPTATFGTFEDVDSALAFAAEWGGRVAVKADGLAAGKGVIVCGSMEEARRALETMLVEKAFGEAGRRVVVEERLEGQEASVIALVDGRDVRLLAPAQDHKRLLDGDLGPNTGGMGAYSPAPIVDEATLERVRREILLPAVAQLATEGREFRGALYAGLMITAEGPKVIEFNCRMGDPETQPIVVRLEDDLLELIEAAANGRMGPGAIAFDERAAMTVVLAAEGYPGKVRKGDRIDGIAEAEADPEVIVFHAGTARRDDELVTAGGRVLGVTALGATLKEARERAYRACEKIRFEGMQYRRDIGHHVLGQEQR